MLPAILLLLLLLLSYSNVIFVLSFTSCISGSFSSSATGISGGTTRNRGAGSWSWEEGDVGGRRIGSASGEQPTTSSAAAAAASFSSAAAAGAADEEAGEGQFDEEDLAAMDELIQGLGGDDPGDDPERPAVRRLPKIGGVYYKRDGNYKAWAASWHIKGKRVRRYFTVKKHGFR